MHVYVQQGVGERTNGKWTLLHFTSLSNHSQCIKTQISIHPHIHTLVTEATMQGVTCSSGALTVQTNSHMEGGTTVNKTGVQLLAKGQEWNQ